MGWGRDARDSAEVFLLPWSGLFAAPYQDLSFDHTCELMDGRLECAYFTQQYDGLPVDNGWLRLVTRPSADFAIVLVASHIYDLAGVEPAASVTSPRAVVERLAAAFPGYRFTDPELVVYVSSLTPPAAACQAYRLKAIVETADSPDGFELLVDASAPDLSIIRSTPLASGFAGITGTVRGQTFVANDANYHSISGCPCGQGQGEHLSDVYVDFYQPPPPPGGSWYWDSAWITDADGQYEFPYPGAPGQVVVMLDSTSQQPATKYVYTDGPGVAELESDLVYGPGQVDLFFPATADPEFDMAHVSAVYWVTQSSKMAAGANSQNQQLGLNTPFRCIVNADYANPSYQPDYIILPRSGYGMVGGHLLCWPNYANGTCIAHEHMHRMRYLAAGGWHAWDYNEGVADAWAALVAGTPCIGLGAFSKYDGGTPCACPDLDSVCLRDLRSAERYPSMTVDSGMTGAAPQACSGFVLSGAVWDLREAVREATGLPNDSKWRKLLINEVLLDPQFIFRAITIDFLTFDDTPGLWGGDGNILNGSPDYDYIARAFGRHNLDAPGLFHASYPDGRPHNVYGGAEELHVRLGAENASGLSPSDVDQVKLYYRLGGSGAFSAVALARPGPIPEDWPDDWTVDFPDPGTGVIQYYVTVRRSGELYEMPDPAEAGAFGDSADQCDQVYLAYSAASLTTILAEDFELGTGWTTDPEVVQPWQRAVPTVFTGAGDPPCAPQYDYDGSGHCYLTYNNPAQGPGVYVPPGDWYLISPVINVGGVDAVVRYASWYSNGHTYRGTTIGYPVQADVFVVEIRDTSSETWLPVDSVGPFEIESMGGWYENYFWLHEVFPGTLPNRIQVRFKASGSDDTGHVEAAIDAFEVVTLGS
jgi:hypothetical protein